MRFNFYEEPDFTEQLAESYEKINRGYERAEQRERENDQIRIQEAGNAKRMIAALAEFVPKAKKLQEAAKAKSEKRQLANYNKSVVASRSNDLKKILYDQFEEGKNVLSDEYIAANKVAQKLKEEGKYTEAIGIIDKTTWKRIRFGVKESIFKNDLLTWRSRFNQKVGDTRDLSSSNLLDAIQQFNAEEKAKYAEWGDAFNQRLSDWHDQQSNALMAAKEEQENKEWENEQDITNQLELKAMIDFDNVDDGSFNKNMLGYMSRRHAELGHEKLGQTYQRVAEDVIALVKANKLTVNQARKFEALYILHKGKEGAPAELMLKSHEKWLMAANWEKELLDAEAEKYEAEAQEAINEKNRFIAEMRQERRDNGGSFTNEMFREKMSTWNYDKYGTPPSDVTEFATDEVVEDDLQERYLNNLWQKGLVTEDAVYKLNDPEKRKIWEERIGTVSPEGISSSDLKSAKAHAVRVANELGKNKGLKQGDNSIATGNIERNTEVYFPGIYARKFDEFRDPTIAYNKAIEELEGIIAKGTYDKLVMPTTDVNKNLRQVTNAQNQLKEDMSVVENSIIFGSEDIIDEAERLHKKNIAHPFYIQLAKDLKINGKKVHPLKIQDMQLEVKAKLEGAGKPVKSVVLQAWEAMPETSQELLSNYVDIPTLNHAKVEAFYKDATGQGEGDGIIDYNDPAINSMVDEILSNKDGKYTEFLNDREVDPRYLFAKSEVDDNEKYRKTEVLFKKLSNRVSYSNYRKQQSDGVAAERLKNFFNELAQAPGAYIQDVFATEAAIIESIGAGLEQRREEVKKENRVNKRKRN